MARPKVVITEKTTFRYKNGYKYKVVERYCEFCKQRTNISQYGPTHMSTSTSCECGCVIT